MGKLIWRKREASLTISFMFIQTKFFFFFNVTIVSSRVTLSLKVGTKKNKVAIVQKLLLSSLSNEFLERNINLNIIY